MDKPELDYIDQRILDYLKTVEKATAYKIAKELGIAWSTIRIHMLELENAGLVVGHDYGLGGVGGFKTYYRLKKKPKPTPAKEACRICGGIGGHNPACATM